MGLAQKQELIRSIILNRDMPSVIFFSGEKTKIEVIDGKQRLTTIISFINNEFSVDGYYHKDFGKEFKITLQIKSKIYYSHYDEKITDEQKISYSK